MPCASLLTHLLPLTHHLPAWLLQVPNASFIVLSGLDDGESGDETETEGETGRATDAVADVGAGASVSAAGNGAGSDGGLDTPTVGGGSMGSGGTADGSPGSDSDGGGWSKLRPFFCVESERPPSTFFLPRSRALYTRTHTHCV
jgi:hypothetical protein